MWFLNIAVTRRSATDVFWCTVGWRSHPGWDVLQLGVICRHWNISIRQQLLFLGPRGQKTAKLKLGSKKGKKKKKKKGKHLQLFFFFKFLIFLFILYLLLVFRNYQFCCLPLNKMNRKNIYSKTTVFTECVWRGLVCICETGSLPERPPIIFFPKTTMSYPT